MVDTWQKFDTWIHTKKMILFIFSIMLFFPILYFLIYPNIGIVGSIVIYFAFLMIVAFLIRIWGNSKFEEES